MRSALRNLRHLAAIPALADWDRGWADESEKGRRIAAARKERMHVARSEGVRALDPELRPYLLGRQHDARIVGFRREGERFTVTAYDDDLAALAAHGYDADWASVEIPFEVIFEGVAYVGWRRIESDDGLVPAPAPAPAQAVDWLDDAFVEPEAPGVRWALQYDVFGFRRRDGAHLLLVEAASVRIEERGRDAWRERFGEAALPLFDRYAAVRADLPLANSPRARGRVRALVDAPRSDPAGSDPAGLVDPARAEAG